MGLLDGIFRRSRRVTDTGITAQLDPPAAGRGLRVGNIQGVGLRERQEDSFAILNATDVAEVDRRGLLAIVADGMGGMADGKLASECAVELFRQQFRERQGDEDIPSWLNACVHTASETVFQQFSGHGGTTLVVAHIYQNALHWVNVGDSALYLYRNGGVFQLNREHTYLNQLYARELAEDIICRERAERDEDARRLSSFVGIDRLTEVDSSRHPLPLHPGDVILLCSDGISGVLTPPDLMEAMSLELDEGCAMLETLVREKGIPEQDNYTGILIAC